MLVWSYNFFEEESETGADESEESGSEQEESEESGSDQSGSDQSVKVTKKPAGVEGVYDIDESDEDMGEKGTDDVDDPNAKVFRDKNIVAWFRQWEGTLHKAFLVMSECLNEGVQSILKTESNVKVS